MGYILKIGALLVASALASLVFGAFAGMTAAESSSGLRKISGRTCITTFRTIRSRKSIVFDREHHTSLRRTLRTSRWVSLTIRMAVRAPLTMLFSLIVAFGINARIALIFLLAVPVLGALLVLIIRKVHPIFRRVFKTTIF